MAVRPDHAARQVVLAGGQGGRERHRQVHTLRRELSNHRHILAGLIGNLAGDRLDRLIECQGDLPCRGRQRAVLRGNGGLQPRMSVSGGCDQT